MHIKINLLLTVLFSLFSITCLAQPDSNFHIYLLAGQSNMAGRGEISGTYITQGNLNVFMLNKSGEWVQAKNPVHFDKPTVAGVGPGLGFGIAMAKKNIEVKIGLVPCAVGGTSINSWIPGGFDKATNTRPYDDAILRVQQAMKAGVIKGVIWHQGEADSRPESAAEYEGKLFRLIKNFRDTIGDENLPFVAGELGRYRAVYSNINAVLRDMQAKDRNFSVVSSKGLTHKGDGTHFNSPSAELLGMRYAKAMKKLHRRSKGL